MTKDPGEGTIEAFSPHKDSFLHVPSSLNVHPPMSDAKKFSLNGNDAFTRLFVLQSATWSKACPHQAGTSTLS